MEGAKINPFSRRLLHSVTTRSEKNFDRDVQLLNC